MRIKNLFKYHTEEDVEVEKGLLFLLKPFFFIIFIWVIFWLDAKYDLELFVFGILPLNPKGLLGILFSPLLHGSLAHLTNNTIPLLVLGSALYYFYPKVANYIVILSWLFSGLIVWFIGRESYHIGASGLIYALVGFIFLSGILRRQSNLLALSLLVVFLYGGLVWGVMPIDEKVSWEAHLSGAFIGFALAYIYRKVSPAQKTEIRPGEITAFGFEEELIEEEEDLIGDAWKEYSGEHSITYTYKPRKPEGND